MTSITLFPGRYIQGRDALSKLGGECARLGGNVFVIASPHPLKHLLPAVLPGVTDACRAVVEPFGRECSDEEIQRLLKLCREAGCDLVLGMGGGKTLDAAKAVAHLAAAPSIMVPTIASTDAPCSSVCVVYTNDGVFKRADILPRNPDSVIVDTGVIAQASPRFLAAGMGDALATWFEAESCRIKRAPNIAGAVGSMTAYALARLCRDTLFDYGPAALASCSARAVTPALERVVEANTLLSGLGFESAGLAAAHSIHNGLTALPRTAEFHHGEKVAFGTLVSLFLTDAHPSLMEQTYGFCESVGLPTTLADLGLEEVSDQELLQVAEKACAPGESIHNEPGGISPETVAETIRAADAWGRKRQDASGLHR
ncbi:MAG: glycerol dehydrogenase [Pseudodesulfovibrio sp.]|uniref:Glycerol dehydrogenase n=1 Tax=Pseudodesulfovibrio aespoeensis (strain ATCC 700646 / DSM 10631 / Aspo-2) TaxID=643562 RepID=E6VTN9_PSEA9|nr:MULTISPECIES: glycerol dehydrogenase [Pseudodesulfovibrio]MBU4191979.1 glycerol dehydrogenase [Pseudomonadota bacterium]ADU63326.1 iron-containing alcohol dehydrogenase [Pseudodesulfovibrio aespoeensis Aspo-2]MBU4244440.1 glycerol dehydrogenase [Pseudomonadota bacterium]MBU4377751.1 glycerol dehydrogenase [Pseudomonadota bacterium]MBU4474936.1 glycerol dehydrogenase [Pseudomonadota bacterium]